MTSMNELLPCPFCGEQPVAIETHPGRGELYCGNCDLVMCGDNAKTPEELTEAWNTRTERTCKRIVHGLERDREVATVSWTCSECHAHIGSDYRYCPFCGAKVV